MSLRKAFAYSFTRTGGAMAIRFLGNLVLARMLGPEQMGIFAVAFAFVLTLGFLRDFGMPRYLLKEAELTGAKVATVFGFALILGVSLAAALFLGRGAIADFYGSEALRPILSVLALSFLLLPFGLPAQALLRRDQRHGPLAAVTVAAAAASATVSVSLAVLGFGALSMAVGALVSSAVTVAMLLWFRPDHLRLRPSLAEWRAVLGFSSRASLGAILVQVNIQLPPLLLGVLVGLAETGLIARAFALVQFFTGVLQLSSNWVTGAAMAEQHRRGEGIGGLALGTIGGLAGVGWPALAVLALKAEAFVLLLYGPAWAVTATLIAPLCIANGIGMLVSQNLGVYEATGEVNRFVRNSALIVVAAAALLVAGAPFGLVVIAWLRIPFQMIVVAVHMHSFRRLAGYGYADLFAAVRKAALVAAGTAAALGAMILLEPEGAGADPLVLVIEMAVLGLVWPGLLYATGHPLSGELTRLFRKLRNRRRP